MTGQDKATLGVIVALAAALFLMYAVAGWWRPGDDDRR